MVQIFILGSSSAYGVGAESAGWADLLKQWLHLKMYGAGGVGEKYEIYNFAQSGATIDFVLANFPAQLEEYGRGGETIVIVAVGGNNSKAEDRPDNFISTPEEYEKEISELFDLLESGSNKVIAVGGGFVDETKTNPKPNPLTGGKSYFNNKRRKIFGDVTKALCQQKGISFAEVDVSEDEWIEKYLYKDGLHPNQEGHQLIFESIKYHIGV
jgi:lysophospholipase L1-like esterase